MPPLTNSHGNPVLPEELEADPAKPYKAYVSAALSAVLAFLTYYLKDKGAFTSDDWLRALAIAIAGSGLIGVSTFAVRNPKKAERKPAKRKKA